MPDPDDSTQDASGPGGTDSPDGEVSDGTDNQSDETSDGNDNADTGTSDDADSPEDEGDSGSGSADAPPGDADTPGQSTDATTSGNQSDGSDTSNQDDQQCLADASNDADQNAGTGAVDGASPSCSSDAPQTAHIVAHVHTPDGQSFQNVTVSVDGKNMSSFTDSSGNADFGEVPVDTYTVTAELGSSKASVTHAAPAGTTTVYDITLPLSVTLSPAAPFVVCGGCTGGHAQDSATATGTPTGGTFAWSTDDATIATVSGSGATVQLSGVAAGVTNVKVVYTVSGATVNATAQVISAHVVLQLNNTGTVTAAPENSTHDADVAASGGADGLGELPMGQGRGDFPATAYTSPLEVIGTVTPNEARTLTYRWKRLIARRSWNIHFSPATTALGITILSAKWEVTQRSRRGFPDDDTGAGSFNNSVPNTNGRTYIYDDSALTLGTDTSPEIGDFIYEEKDFTYRLERNLRGTFVTCAEFHVGQIETVKRIAKTGTVTSDWQGLGNSTAIRTVSATMDQGKVRAIVGGSDAIDIASDANN